MSAHPKKARPRSVEALDLADAGAKPAGMGDCPGCGKPYPRTHKRCYACKPPGRPHRSGSPVNSPPKDRRPDVEGDGSRRGHISPARAELRAMAEVLWLLEKVEPDAARRVLAWVSERLG